MCPRAIPGIQCWQCVTGNAECVVERKKSAVKVRMSRWMAKIGQRTSGCLNTQHSAPRTAPLKLLYVWRCELFAHRSEPIIFWKLLESSVLNPRFGGQFGSISHVERGSMYFSFTNWLLSLKNNSSMFQDRKFIQTLDANRINTKKGWGPLIWPLVVKQRSCST